MKASQGYVALLTILIVGAAALTISVTLLTTSADSQRSALVSVNASQARQLANACAEEALRVLRDTQTYTGSSNLTLSTGSCSYIVTNNGGQSRLITTSSTINSVVKKMTVYATIGTSSISVTSWRES